MTIVVLNYKMNFCSDESEGINTVIKGQLVTNFYMSSHFITQVKGTEGHKML